MASKLGPQKTFDDINVTPLVDVMLVLLVIFMIAAPLMFNGIELKLPRTQESNPINIKKEQVILSLTKTKELFIGKKKVLSEELIPLLKQEFSEKKTDVLFLRADFSIRYGIVAKIMGQLKANGIQKIALVTETEVK